MFKKLFTNNPKTTAMAIMAIIGFIAKMFFKTELSPEVLGYIQDTIIALLTIGVMISKDGDKN